MFDCELIAADDDNISYSLGEYIYIKQVTDEMEELGGYSIHSIGLEDGSPIWQGKKEVAPKQFTGSTIKAGRIHYRQGLGGLDESPIIKLLYDICSQFRRIVA
jgi:hypothetical protein